MSVTAGVAGTITHKELGGRPIVVQELGKPSFNEKHFWAIGEAFHDMLKQEHTKVTKANRGYANNSIEIFMRMSYPQLYNEKGVRKDDTALTTTTGFYNATFGNVVWEQINNEANMFGLLPKRPHDRSGWRVLTAAGATSGGGVVEDAAPPATIKPTLATLSTKAKTIATTFDVSALQQASSMVPGDDSLENTFQFLRNYSAREHAKLINRMLLTDVGTLASNNIESVDRVISSNAEVSNVGIDAGDSDIYSQDRDAGTGWTDAYVNHNSNVDRSFSLALVDTLFTNTYPFADPGDQYILVTGYDTLDQFQQQRSDQVRYRELGERAVTHSLNGISSVAPGVDGGFMVSSYRGVPIFVSNDMVSDTISRVYLVNLSKLFVRVLMPTQYFQTGVFTDRNPFGINAIADEGMFLTMAELIAPEFNVHGKLRDLKT